MPGLINKSKWTSLPLSVSDITSCVRGYTLAMTASLTYENIEDHDIEGLFIYPLEESSVVVGFEAMIGSQIITLQVKDKSKQEDGSGQLLLDEGEERGVLVVSLGLIPALETVNIQVSTSSELSTLTNGGVRVVSPSVCSPRVQRSVRQEQRCSISSGQRPRSLSSAPAGGVASLLEDDTINSIDYQFSFQLEIRGPYLLAGVESPSHAIRADAAPSARSASSITVTLADKYTYDRPVEILIYPSEPHLPHVLIEDGDMTPQEYDEHLRGRSEYLRATKKDSSGERTVGVIRKRLHKDILHNPVVMLNFCPDLRDSSSSDPPDSSSSDLRRLRGEFIFLLDLSAGVDIGRVKDAMLVVLKSLFPSCLFNIVSFGSKFSTLFPSSRSYDEESLSAACQHVKRIRADMGGADLLAPLTWVTRQPLQRGHARLLFILTHAAITNTGQIVELMRSHARSTRCFTLAVGGSVCVRLLSGLSAVTRGASEFLTEGERLQPKMIGWLRSCMAPVLTDVSVQWLFPETAEVLLSPLGSACVFPGERLIAYSVVCDASRHHAHPRPDRRRRYSMTRSGGSSGSVFYRSQEEEEEGHVTQRVMSSAAEPPRRRAYSTNQICEGGAARKLVTSSDPGSVLEKNPLRRAPVQQLLALSQTEAGVDQSVCVVQDGSRSSTDSPPPDAEGYTHQLCEVVEEEESPPSDGRCKAVVTGLLSGKAVRWEVTFDLEPHLNGREREEKVHEELWNESFHHLAARSVIRDFELMAEKEREIEHGRRHQLYAAHTSRSCNVLSRFTTFVPVDLDSGESISGAVMSVRHRGQDTPRPVIGSAPSSSSSDEGHTLPTLPHRRCHSAGATPVTCDPAPGSVEGLFQAGRLSLTRSRLLTKAARGFMSRSQGGRSSSSAPENHDNSDYVPLVLLQLSCGAFALDSALCQAVGVPMDKLRWTSPFTRHRLSATQRSHSPDSSSSEAPPSPLNSASDSGRGSESDASEAGPEGGGADPEGRVWATAVALAWLEHSSAQFFVEWELIAAKASAWLDQQTVPEGRGLPAVKAAANQLFVILRHWDENLQLNMLCYSPGSV